MRRARMSAGVFAGSVLPVFGLLVAAQDKQVAPDQERKVTEAEVPPAALTALKRLAGGAATTAFAEETERGNRYYEASWKTPDGTVDALVTAAGDLVEIEEVVPADKVPAAVRGVIEKEGGKDAKPTFEKKTLVLYEAHFKKGDKTLEIIVTPDGRLHLEGGARKDVQGDEGDDD